MFSQFGNSLRSWMSLRVLETHDFLHISTSSLHSPLVHGSSPFSWFADEETKAHGGPSSPVTGPGTPCYGGWRQVSGRVLFYAKPHAPICQFVPILSAKVLPLPRPHSCPKPPGKIPSQRAKSITLSTLATDVRPCA